jgi:hypothetical protein
MYVSTAVCIFYNIILMEGLQRLRVRNKFPEKRSITEQNTDI